MRRARHPSAVLETPFYRVNTWKDTKAGRLKLALREEEAPVDVSRIERCLEALKDDRARQSGLLRAEDVARLIDRRALSADEAAEVWRRLEELGLLSLTPEAAADEVVIEVTGGQPDSGREAERELDLLGLFIGDIRGVPLLSDAKVTELAHLVRAGVQAEEAVQSGAISEHELGPVIERGRAARDQFVQANIRLVIYFAKEYFSIPGVEKLDIIQDGVIGLMKAVDRFEPSRGYRFATYAVWWIRQRILRGLTEREGMIQLPQKLADKLRRMAKKRHQFKVENGRLPTLLELAREMEIDPGEVRFLQQLHVVGVSFDDPAPGTGELTIGDSMADGTAPDPLERLAQAETLASVQRNLAAMSKRDRAILERRFGLDGDDEATLQEIGDEFGLSRERVRQIVDKAVAEFRNKAAWKVLR